MAHFTLLIAVLGLARTCAFTAISPSATYSKSLRIRMSPALRSSLAAMNNNHEEECSVKSGNKGTTSAALGIVLGTYILSNVIFSSPVVASVGDDYGNNDAPSSTGSSLVVAARSGGRAGGRSSMSSSRSYAPARSTTIIRPTIGIAPAPVIVSPFGFGYNPLGGFGLGYGLGAASNMGNEFRDYNQEREITQSKIDLEQTKAREAALEQRLKALEDAQRAVQDNK
jgi:hypothetical protein